MNNISHVRFAADQLAWFVYNNDLVESMDDFNDLIEQIISFHNLDISPSYFDLIDSLAQSYYNDINASRLVGVSFGE